MQKIDFIATKNGLKPLMDTYCRTFEEFKKIDRICRSQGLFAFRSKLKIKNLAHNLKEKVFHVFISKDKKIAQKYADEDPEHSKISNKSKLKNLSIMLGYPRCCIDAYLKLDLAENITENEKKEILFRKIMEERKPFLLNNFLYGLGFSLSFYQPCSYHCKKALEYNKKILEAVRKEDPYFAVEIEKYLRLPLLIWFDANSDVNNFFHNRIQLLFNGRLDKSNIFYNDVILYRKYPYCNSSFKENQLEEFFLGNRCQVCNDKIKIFSKNKILSEIEINNKYHGVLVKFN